MGEPGAAHGFVGNRAGLTYSGQTSESFACAYDEWDQLTAFGSSEGDGYLAPPAAPAYYVGTLHAKGGATYAYPLPGTARPYAPSSVSTLGSLTYDANGRRSTDPTSTYTYDIEGRLTTLMQGGATALANTYDGDGLRLVRVAGGATTHFVGDWYEVDVTTGVATVYYPFNGQAIAMSAGGTLSYLHRDHKGSLASATNVAEGELGRVRPRPFRRCRTPTAP